MAAHLDSLATKKALAAATRDHEVAARLLRAISEMLAEPATACIAEVEAPACAPGKMFAYVLDLVPLLMEAGVLAAGVPEGSPLTLKKMGLTEATLRLLVQEVWAATHMYLRFDGPSRSLYMSNRNFIPTVGLVSWTEGFAPKPNYGNQESFGQGIRVETAGNLAVSVSPEAIAEIRKLLQELTAGAMPLGLAGRPEPKPAEGAPCPQRLGAHPPAPRPAGAAPCPQRLWAQPPAPRPAEEAPRPKPAAARPPAQEQPEPDHNQ